jgi:hypothetical protein
MTQQQRMLRQLNEAIAGKATTPPPSHQVNRIKQLIDKVHLEGGLELEGEQREKPDTGELLSEKIKDKDRADQQREGHLAYGHTYSPIHKGPVRLWYSVRY